MMFFNPDSPPTAELISSEVLSLDKFKIPPLSLYPERYKVFTVGLDIVRLLVKYKKMVFIHGSSYKALLLQYIK